MHYAEVGPVLFPHTAGRDGDGGAADLASLPAACGAGAGPTRLGLTVNGHAGCGGSGLAAVAGGPGDGSTKVWCKGSMRSVGSSLGKAATLARTRTNFFEYKTAASATQMKMKTCGSGSADRKASGEIRTHTV